MFIPITMLTSSLDQRISIFCNSNYIHINVHKRNTVTTDFHYIFHVFSVILLCILACSASADRKSYFKMHGWCSLGLNVCVFRYWEGSTMFISSPESKTKSERNMCMYGGYFT